MTDVLIKRELLERIRNLLYTIAHRQDDYGVEAECIGSFLPAILAAPSQPEGEGLEIRALEHNGITVSYRLASPHELRNGTPLIRLSDAQRAIAELRDRLDVMTQCADNYSRMFEESEEECERLRSECARLESKYERDVWGLNNEGDPIGGDHPSGFANDLLRVTIERDTLRQQLAERDAEIMEQCRLNGMGAERELKLMTQRDKLAGLLADVKADYAHAIHWEDLHATMKRIDAVLAEVKP